MTKSETKHKVFTPWAAAAALALAVSLIFTACPQTTGGGGDALADKTENVEGIQFTMKGIAAVTNGKIGHADQEHNGERTVSLTAYHIGQTEVTQDLWEAVMGGNPSAFSGGSNPPASGETQGARPVERVNWYSAIAFCNKLSLKLGRAPVYSVTVGGTPVDFESLTISQIPTVDNTDWNAVTADWSVNGFRLPTEAEWEWAAQDGSARRKWAGANDESALASCAWYRANGGDKTHAAGKKSANAFGLSDMSGNVQEWCWDWYGDLTPGGGEDPTGEAGGTKRSMRGGSWKEDAANAACAFRSGLESFKTENTLGFRLVCRPQGKIPVTYNKDTGAGQVGSVKFTMKKIDAVTNGTIGHNDQDAIPNKPHTVTLSQYYLGETEVTQELYEAVMGNNPSFFDDSGNKMNALDEPVDTSIAAGEVQKKRPVENVNWYHALAFCNALTQKTGLGDDACVYWLDGHVYNTDDAGAKKVPEGRWSNKGFRLPTEAEWEWAAQGGSTRHKWAGTDTESALTGYAWYESNSGNKTHEVKQKNANAFGLYDMSGNIYEWCWDGFVNQTPAGGLTDPLGAESDSYKVCRGGSYQSKKEYNACAFRSVSSPEFFLTPDMYTGIRLACGAMTPSGRCTVRFSAEGGRIEANINGNRFYSGDTAFTGQKVWFHAYAEDSDYELKNWTNNGTVIAEASNAVVYNHTVTADADIKVTFIKKSDPIIRFSVDGGHGTLKAIVKGKEISSGEQVPLRSNVHFIAKPESGYTVDGWTKNGDSVNGTHLGYNYSATENADVRVRFKVKTYTVRFGAEGGGTVSATVDGSPISSPYEAVKGTQMVFSAMPDTYYRLKEWTCDGSIVSTETPYTYTVGTKAVNIKALFDVNRARVSFTANENGSGSVKAYINGSPISSGSLVEHGKEILFIGWPGFRKAIDKWECDGSVLTETGVDPQYRHTVTAPVDGQPLNVKVYFSEADNTKTFTAAGVNFKMILINPAVDGTVGSNNISDNNEHEVSLSTYYIADTEVTQELWEKVMSENPSHYNNPDDPARKNRPVENVTWVRAVLFCNILTEEAGLGESECVYWCNGHTYGINDILDGKDPEMKMGKRGFRLPTEAEWEWAAQDGSLRYTWAGTNDKSNLPNYAWYNVHAAQTYPVTRKQPTTNGLYDMSGNVAEWCWDWYTDTTPAGGINPTGAQSGNKHAIRGGSYNSSASGIKCAFRDKSWNGNKDVGLRVVKRP